MSASKDADFVLESTWDMLTENVEGVREEQMWWNTACYVHWRCLRR